MSKEKKYSKHTANLPEPYNHIKNTGDAREYGDKIKGDKHLLRSLWGAYKRESDKVTALSNQAHEYSLKTKQEPSDELLQELLITTDNQQLLLEAYQRATEVPNK